MNKISEFIKIKNLETTIENITNFIKKEIFEIYRGFSIGQLAAFKAHYVTMGKMEKVK